MINKINFWGVFILIITIVAYKIIIVSSILEKATGCIDCYYMPLIFNDSILVGVILFLLFSLSFINNRLFTIVIKILIISSIFIYFADIIIVKTFTTRLYLDDIFKYGLELKAGISFFETIIIRNNNTIKIYGYFIVIFLTILIIILFFTSKIKLNYSIAKIGFIASCALSTLWLFRDNHGYVHSWAYKNLVEINYYNSAARSYSKEFRTQLINHYPDNIICEARQQQQPNIIILMIESLSSYQSNFFSGINNFLPNLDQIAVANTAFTNFFANGYKSEHGLIAILLGKHPILKPNEVFESNSVSATNNSEFNGFYDRESLPKILKTKDYRTYFLTTSYLEYSNWDSWLRNIGFDFIEDSKSPWYANEIKFNFSAASDKVLLNRVLHLIDEIRTTTKFFILIETVSTHHPFIHPERGENTEEAVFRYTDQQIKSFYDELNKKGFFNNGILVITGDHRAMTPLSKSEKELFGESAFARIPLIISGHSKIPTKIDSNFQQTDIFTSISSLIQDRYCRKPEQGNIFSDHLIPPNCIFHVRGDERNLVYVSCGQNDALIKLDGDETRITWGNIPNHSAVINYINYERLID